MSGEGQKLMNEVKRLMEQACEQWWRQDCNEMEEMENQEDET